MMGKTVVTEDVPGARPPTTLRHALDLRRPVLPDQRRSHPPGRYLPTWRPTSPAGRRRSTAAQTAARATDIAVGSTRRTGVQQVYDAFDRPAGPSTSSAAARPDRRPTSAARSLRSRSVDECSYAPFPFFASAAGWGSASRAERRRAAPSRARREAASCAVGRRAAVHVPAAPDRDRGLHQRRAPRRGPLPRPLCRRSPTTSRTPASPSPRLRRSSR